MDAFLDMASWKDYTLIPMLCDLIVTSRPGMQTDSTASVIPVALQSVFCYDLLQGQYKHASTHTLTFHEIAGFDVSATTIRSTVRQGKSIRYLVPAPVERYLAEAGLYRREESAR